MKVFRSPESLNTVLEARLGVKQQSQKTFIFVTKLTGATTGAAGAEKGAVHEAEVFACGNGVCFVVCCVGVAADSLEIVAIFVLGPNLTSLVTTPI